VICFSLIDPVSLENIKTKWIPEIKRETGGHCKYILVGTKSDLREDKKTLEILQAKNQKPVTKEEGDKFAAEVGAKGFIGIYR
jgi:Ras-related C3 botulinum toxin substrate 1